MIRYKEPKFKRETDSTPPDYLDEVAIEEWSRFLSGLFNKVLKPDRKKPRTFTVALPKTEPKVTGKRHVRMVSPKEHRRRREAGRRQREARRIRQK